MNESNSAPSASQEADQSPRERAERALTVLLHEQGAGVVRLSGITLADIRVDLAQRVADAIADAEDAARALQQAEIDQLRVTLTNLETLLGVYGTPVSAYDEAERLQAEYRVQQAEIAALKAALETAKGEMGHQRIEQARVESECLLLRRDVARLTADRAALLRVCVKALEILEGLHLSVQWELAPSIMALIGQTIQEGRAALLAAEGPQ